MINPELIGCDLSGRALRLTPGGDLSQTADIFKTWALYTAECVSIHALPQAVFLVPAAGASLFDIYSTNHDAIPASVILSILVVA